MSSLMQTLIDWGFLDAILPFILLFVLIFAILQKIGIFQEDNKPNRRINAVIALVISAMIVIPHVAGLYHPDYDPIIIINQFLPSVAVILLAILCVMFLLGLAGGGIPSLMLWAIVLVALGFLIVMMMMAIIPGFLPAFDFLRDPAIQALIIIMLVMGLVGYFVIREPEAGGPGFGEWIQKWFTKVQ
jgi:hypothetical protein